MSRLQLTAEKEISAKMVQSTLTGEGKTRIVFHFENDEDAAAAFQRLGLPNGQNRLSKKQALQFLDKHGNSQTTYLIDDLRGGAKVSSHNDLVQKRVSKEEMVPTVNVISQSRLRYYNNPYSFQNNRVYFVDARRQIEKPPRP